MITVQNAVNSFKHWQFCGISSLICALEIGETIINCNFCAIDWGIVFGLVIETGNLSIEKIGRIIFAQKTKRNDNFHSNSSRPKSHPSWFLREHHHLHHDCAFSSDAAMPMVSVSLGFCHLIAKPHSQISCFGFVVTHGHRHMQKFIECRSLCVVASSRSGHRDRLAANSFIVQSARTHRVRRGSERPTEWQTFSALLLFSPSNCHGCRRW